MESPFQVGAILVQLGAPMSFLTLLWLAHWMVVVLLALTYAIPQGRSFAQSI